MANNGMTSAVFNEQKASEDKVKEKARWIFSPKTITFFSDFRKNGIFNSNRCAIKLLSIGYYFFIAMVTDIAKFCIIYSLNISYCHMGVFE